MSLSPWVCLYLSLFVTMSVPLCVTIYPVSPCVLLTAQATGGRVGPTGARAVAQPGPPLPAMGQAGRLFAMPATGKHRDPEPKGHLPPLCSLPLSLPWTGLCPKAPAGAVPTLEACLDPPLRHGHKRPRAPSPGLALPVCPSASLSLSLSFWVSPGLFLFLSVLTSSLLSYSAALPFSGMTLVSILSLSLYLPLSLFSLSEVSFPSLPDLTLGLYLSARLSGTLSCFVSFSLFPSVPASLSARVCQSWPLSPCVSEPP